MKKALICFAILLGAGAFLCGCNKELTPEEIQMRSLMGEEIWTPADISKEIDETKKECTVIIPKGFYRSTELYPSLEGANDLLYMTKDYPAVDANIYIGEGNDELCVKMAEGITQEEYVDYLIAAYNDNYGYTPNIEVVSYEELTIDGCKAIKAHLILQAELSDNQSGIDKIEQLQLLVKGTGVTSITYSQATDDELWEVFEESAQTISVNAKK